MPGETLLKFITGFVSPAIIAIILTFTLMGLISHKNKGWGYLALGWFANLVYLQFESFDLAKTLTASSISSITYIVFLAYCFSILRDRWKWIRAYYAYIVGFLVWATSLTIFLFNNKFILHNLNIAQFVKENFILFNLPLMIFSTISITLSAFVLNNFLTKERLESKFYLTIPWGLYGFIQMSYLFMLLENKMIISLAFIFALILKAVIAFGLIWIFKEQTEQAQIKRDRFLHSKRQLLTFSWFSHELKTPTFALRTFALTLLKRLRNREYSKATVDANKLIYLSKQLVSIVESVAVASEPIHREKLKIFSINDALDKAVFSVKQIYFLKTSDIQKEFNPDLYVCGIEENFVQVFANIIRNAVEAIEAEKNKMINDKENEEKKIDGESDEISRNKNKFVKFKLKIDTSKVMKKERNYVLIKIIDFGPGIPKDIIDSIFDAYFSSKKGINRGLGLWVVREFVEMFGGFIEVDSPLKRLKFGTQFNIYLPLVEDSDIDPNVFWTKIIRQQWEEI